jgi:hypothetical protein
MIAIEYDRKDRVYRWTDPDSGECFSFPPKQKSAAFQFAVSMLDPDLFAAARRIIENHPQLERVSWRAVELVANEAVEVFAVPRDNVLAMVHSSDGYGRYAVQTEDGYLTCQCQHFTSYAAPMTETGSRYCKHIVAMHLWRVVREDRF